MESIIKESDMSKEYKIWDNSNLYTKNDYSELPLNQSISLTQGDNFKKKQKKNKNAMEGFSQQSTNTQQTHTAQQSNNILSQTKLSSSDQINITNLKTKFTQSLEDYQKLFSEITGSVNTNISRSGSNNPYLSKNIYFTNGKICYVTNKGVAKPYPNFFVYRRTIGINGCPSRQEIVSVNIPFLSSYIEGATIPTTPSLIVGTPMIQGQSCGNEGKNVFVNTLIKNSEARYLGCYADNSSSPSTMTFIGSSPSASNITIVNGDFSQPPIANNTYVSYSGTNTVPGWFFNATVLNNYIDSSYPRPYPNGNQCVQIYYNQYIYQLITLPAGTYSISFYLCGAPYNGASAGNPINVVIASTNPTPTQATLTYNFVPILNTWTTFTQSFDISTSDTFQITFVGTTDGIYSAIQSVALSPTANTTGSYTYSTCKQAAIDDGYKYFALQNVNSSTSQGYCAVSNDEFSSEKNGTTYAVSGQTALWASNTSNQTGNTASFDNGSISVNNSTSAIVFSSPNTTPPPNNYIGCYKDKKSRAMSMYNNGKRPYNNTTCQQAADSIGAAYYGLQSSNTGQNAQCFTSNNLSQSKKYGVAKNCTLISDGSWTGGDWSNAIYTTNTPETSYFLVLQDDGNMCIYIGSSPSDNQGAIWCTMTNGKQQKPNPLMVSSKNKFGQNWMPSGSVLNPGEFLSSTQGDLVLTMQSDGNLVLYTYQTEINCNKMADGNTGGGIGANSLYKLINVGIPGNLEKISYIDQDSKLYTYPSSNIKLGSTYTKIANYNTTGNDLPQAGFGNATADSCQTACNNNDSCGGFVFDNTNSICWPKTTEMYPNSSRQPLDNNDIYTRNQIVSPLPPGISSKIQNIDSIQYQNYVSSGQDVGGNMNSLQINSVQKAQLEQLQSTLELLANKIVSLNGSLNLSDIKVTSQSAIDSLQLGKYLVQYKITDKKIDEYNSAVNTNIQNILDDSEIIVLQQNYKYMFWSILAVGTVLLSMNVV